MPARPNSKPRVQWPTGKALTKSVCGLRPPRRSAGLREAGAVLFFFETGDRENSDHPFEMPVATVTLELDPASFAFWDVDADAWTVEPGRFRLLLGNSSQNVQKELDVRAETGFTL